MKTVLRVCVLLLCAAVITACMKEGGSSESTATGSPAASGGGAKKASGGAAKTGGTPTEGRQLFPNASFEQWDDGKVKGWNANPGTVKQIEAAGLPGQFGVALVPDESGKVSLRTSLKEEAGFGGQTLNIKTNVRSESGSATVTLGSKQTGPFWSGVCKSAKGKFASGQFSVGVPAEVEDSIWVVVSADGAQGVELDHFSAKLYAVK